MTTSNERIEALRRAFDPDQLIQTVQEMTGLCDFGDEHFLVPLRKLVDCAINDVDFHDQGVAYFIAAIERSLTNRLRAEADFKRHPEIFEEDVSDPIIIIGLGRSGTTKLQKMLSAPDDVQKLLLWRLYNPAPFPDAIPGAPDPRIEALNSSGMMVTDNKEEMDKAHNMAAMEVEEDVILYILTFEEFASWCTLIPSSSFFDWLMQRPGTEAYRYVKKLLQYLQWQDGGKQNRPWILKSIAHTAYMDSLLECYPNATLVHTHRDPLHTIPSWAKLWCEYWQITSKPVDPHIAGRQTIKFFKTAMDRYLEARKRLCLDDRILDVRYEDVRTDSMTVMKAVYEKSGRTMSADAEQKMADWDRNNEQGKHGKHEYSLEQFGLTPDMIDEAFEEYIDRFITRQGAK